MSATLVDAIRAGFAPPLAQFTIDEVNAMLDAGALRDAAPFELIDGMLVTKDRRDPGMPEERPMVHGPRHAATIRRIDRAFKPWQPNPHWCLTAQLPVEISRTQSPEPDSALLRGPIEDYDERHPTPADVLALIEAAGTSLRYDRTTKQRIYAESEVPLYLVINLEDKTIERHEDPAPAEGVYRRRTVLKPDDTLRLDLPGTGPIEIPVASLLPGAV